MPEQKSVADGVRAMIREEPEWYGLALDTYELALADHYSIDDVSYKSLFLQQYLGRPRDPAVAGFIIAFFHFKLAKGDAAAIRIQVGSTPRKDDDIAGNDEALQGLPEPFKATFWGGKQDSDGKLFWDPTHPRAPQHPAWQETPAEDGNWGAQVPLEVGFTDTETLAFHYRRGGGFARWPYGCEDIIAIRRIRSPEEQPQPDE